MGAFPATSAASYLDPLELNSRGDFAGQKSHHTHARFNEMFHHAWLDERIHCHSRFLIASSFRRRSSSIFNVAKGFKSFFNYSGFFLCVLGALSPIGELGDPNLNGVSCDKSRLEQLGKRYASDPLCVSVVLTCANFMSKEMHLPKSPEDRAQWKARGDYEAKLLEVYKKYTDEWARAFPKQSISLHLAKVADLPMTFNERVIAYGLSKYPERFTIQNCQLTGRREDTGTMSYDLILKYGDQLHHGFQSLAAFGRGGERMGSVQMAVLNVVHGTGEYWELWHGDGLSAETSGEVAKAWEEAKRLGYSGYKQKLISEGSYRAREDDNYRPRGRERGRGRQKGRGVVETPET
jgi:hypothetical protein